MESPVQVAQAFEAASSVSPDTAHAVFVAILAAVMLLWLSWTFSEIGQRFMAKQISIERAVWYLVRAVVLTLSILLLLVR